MRTKHDADSAGYQGKMQRSDRRFDKYMGAPLHELPLFAAFGQPEEEPVEMLTLTFTDTPPPDNASAGAAPTLAADDAAVPVAPGKTEPAQQPAARLRRRKTLARDSFVRHDANPDRGPLTADALLAAIETWSDVLETRRLAMKTAMRHAAHILSLSAAQTHGHDPWSCAGLNRALWSQPPRAFGLTKSTFRNMISSLRYMFCRLGRHADAGYGRSRLSRAWQVHYENLPTVERRRGMVLFLRFLTLQGIEPEAVAANAIDEFESFLRTQMLHKDIGGMGRRAAGNWHFARQNVPGWPQVEIVRADMKDLYTIPLSAYPANFQREVETMLGEMAGGAPEGSVAGNPYRLLHLRATAPATVPTGQAAPRSPRSRRRRLRQRTIETRRDQLMFAASALVLSGVPIAQIVSLSTLVSPIEHPVKILEFHLARRGRRLEATGRQLTEADMRCSHLAGIGEVLRQIAKFHAFLPEDELAALLDYVAQVKPEAQTQMTEKNLTRLKALFAEPVHSMLLDLPREWMRRAALPSTSGHEGALLAMYAIAVELILVVPLRRTNLAQLQLDTQLRRPNPKALINEISIPAALTKTDTAINWPLGRDSAKLVELYLSKYRPLLAKEGSNYLFPSMNGGHRNLDDFAATLSERVSAELGVAFNLHLARHFSAVQYLRENPGAYHIAAMILGHKSPETTRKFYTGLELDAAARHVNAVVASKRRKAKIIAVGAFHRTKRRAIGTRG